MKTLSERLNKLYDKRQELRRLESHLKNASVDLTAKMKDRDSLEEELNEMDRNLNRPAGSKLIGFISHLLLIPKSDAHDRETSEKYLIAHVQLQKLQRDIDLRAYEIKIMKQKIAGLKPVEELYKQLFNDKKQQLKFRYQDIADKIILLESSIRHQTYHQKQIIEALEIGKILEQEMTKLSNGLDAIITQSAFHFPPEYAGRPGTQLTASQRNKAQELEHLLRIIDKLCISFAEKSQNVKKEYELSHIPFSSLTSDLLEKFHNGFMSDFVRRRVKRITLTNIDSSLKKVRELLVSLRIDLVESREIESTQQEKLSLIVLANDIH